MYTWKIKTVIATLAVGTLLQAVPQDADAFLFRWLRQRRAARVAYYGGYGGCGTTCGFTPRVAAYTPQPACQSCNTCAVPVAPACPTPCATPCTTTQRVCSYCPQTTYRTVYRQVPVTVYRPQTTCDPCTGCPRTVMHPCTTVQHVAQRVPVTTYRQVCRNVTVPAAVSAAPAVPVVNAAPVLQQQPVFQQQPMVQQQFSAPVQQFAPATPGCTNCGTAPAAGAAIPFAATPAQPQQLAPIPQSGPTTSLTNPQPSHAQPTPADNIPTLNSQQQPSQPYLPNTGGASFQQGSASRSSLRSEPPATYQPRMQNLDIRPLPDLDRAPALLNPDDRTAAQPLVKPGAIVPISWQTPVAAPARAQPATHARPKVRRLKDSGWSAARSY